MRINILQIVDLFNVYGTYLLGNLKNYSPNWLPSDVSPKMYLFPSFLLRRFMVI